MLLLGYQPNETSQRQQQLHLTLANLQLSKVKKVLDAFAKRSSTFRKL